MKNPICGMLLAAGCTLMAVNAMAVTLQSSQYIGGTGSDFLAGAVALDATTAYVGGHTLSDDFAGSDLARDTNDVYVSRVGQSPSTLIHTTQRLETATAVALAGDGSVLVAGYYEAAGQVGKKLFLYRFDFEKNMVTEVSGLPDGDGNDYAYGLMVVGNDAYLAGHSNSSNFCSNETVAVCAGTDGDIFVLRLNLQTEQMTAMAVLHAAGDDVATAISADASGQIYITGTTQNLDAEAANMTVSQFIQAGGGTDSFVARFDGSLALNYLAVFGGEGHDAAHAIAIAEITEPSAKTIVFIAGESRTATDGYNGDAFLARLDPADGVNPLNIVYWGGGAHDLAQSIGLTGNTVVIAGQSNSDDFSNAQLPGALQTRNVRRTIANTSKDTFVLQYDLGAQLIFASLIGGSGTENPAKLATLNVDADQLWLAVQSDSEDLPRIPADDTAYKGDNILVSQWRMDTGGTDLTLSVNEPLPPHPQSGSTFMLPLTITRSGDKPGYVRLVMSLPAGMVFEGISPTMNCLGFSQRVTCDYYTFNTPQTIMLDLQSTIPGDAGLLLRAWSNLSDSATLDNELEHSIALGSPFKIDLALDLTGQPNPVNVGSTLRYTHIITNKGPNTANQIHLHAVLDNDVNVQGIRMMPNTIRCSQSTEPDKQFIDCELDSLTDQQQASIGFDVTARGNKSVLTLTSDISALDNDTNLTNNKKIATTNVNLDGATGNGGGPIGWLSVVMAWGLLLRRRWHTAKNATFAAP